MYGHVEIANTVRLTGSKASHIDITRGILGQRLRNAGLARRSESRNPPQRAASPLHLLLQPPFTPPLALFAYLSLSLVSSSCSYSPSFFSSPPRLFFSPSFHREFPRQLPPPSPPSFPPSPPSLTYVRQARCALFVLSSDLPQYLLPLPLFPFSSCHSRTLFSFSPSRYPDTLLRLDVPHVDIHAALFPPAYPLFLFLPSSLSIYSCRNVIFSPPFVADC